MRYFENIEGYKTKDHICSTLEVALGTSFGYIRLASMFLTMSLIAVNSNAGFISLAEIGKNFTASTFRVDSDFIPPDSMGAVGVEHYVELINGRYSVYDKETTERVQTKTLDRFWRDAGIVPTNFSFDPRILYDKTSDRWFAVAIDNNEFGNNFLVAVSRKSNPTLGWHAFTVDSDTDNSHLADFPQLGADADGLYITANMFPSAGSDLRTAVLAIPKADLVGRPPSVVNATLLQDIEGPGFAAQAAINFDNVGIDSGTPLPILSAINKPSGRLKFSTVSGSITAPALNVDDTAGRIAVTPRGSKLADQPGPKQDIETNSRFSASIIVQEGFLWAVHSVEFDDDLAVEWYRIDPSLGLLLESGLIHQPDLDFFFPSIAVNESNKIVIGFSGSGANQFVSSYGIIGEFDGKDTEFDPNGPTLLRAGVDDYELTLGTRRNRWGDYSATTIDPLDDTRFWTIQQFVSDEDVWSTQVTEIRVVTTPEPATLLLYGFGISAIVIVRLQRNRIA